MKMRHLAGTAVLASFFLFIGQATSHAPPTVVSPFTQMLKQEQQWLKKYAAKKQKRKVVIHSKPPEEKDYIIMKFEVTAYTLGYESTGKRRGHPLYGLTASGKKVRPHDKVVAAPKHIPFGTVMEIPGYGRAVVLDRGGAIKYNPKTGLYKLDILMPTVEDALEFGKRILTVKVYKKAP